MEKLPETMEKMSQTMEKILQVLQKMPETIEKVITQTMEKLPRPVEKLPQTMEKLPQTVDGVEKFPFQDEWLEAMREEDGFTLMELVAKEPHLLTLKYVGRNALHLAMRHDWYGLVQEILLQFEHLYTIEEEEESSSDRLDLDVLRDLLTCKEGVDKMSKTSGSSRLDVFAMAVIHCHRAINTLLVRTVSKLPKLFAEHNIYNDVVTHTPITDCSFERDPDSFEARLFKNYVEGCEQNESQDRSQERKILREYLENEFPHFTEWLRLDYAPSMCFDQVLDPVFVMTETDTEVFVITESHSQSERRNRPYDYRLIMKGDSAVGNWMLTCPFLPLSEYLILDYSHNPENSPLTKSLFDRFLLAALEEIPNYFEYVGTISDTRRLVLHHAVLWSWAFKSGLHPLIPRIIKVDIWDRVDSSGRSVLHLLVALEPNLVVQNLLRDLPSNLFCYKHTADRGVWGYNSWWCRINLSSVLRANGYVYYKDESQLQIQCKEHVILTSPHLKKPHRLEWFKLLKDRPIKEPRPEYLNLLDQFTFGLDTELACPRPSVHAGAVSHRLVTPLQLGVLMGDTTLVQLMAQNDEFSDFARMKNGADFRRGWNWESDDPFESALHLAAKQADPEMLRMILETGKFDPQYQDQQGNTLLHAVVRCEDPTHLPVTLIDFVEIPNECPHELRDLQMSLMTNPQQREKEELYRESRRQGCINVLIQEGLDVWETNKSGKIPDPGPKASPGYSLWWYERLTHETLEQKTSFNAASTAISVTAALVAIASYVGPLQPPLAYSWNDEDGVSKVQAEIVGVRVFFVLNTLAFYVAVAAVVISLTPVLPVPHEPTREEMKRIRRSVIWALMLLILSLIAILSAFASASIIVIPNAGRWNQSGLTTGPVIVGCIICVVVLIVCCKRAFRLVCQKNSTVGRLYRNWIEVMKL